MPISINVNKLAKTYEYFKKEPGIAGSIKSLFWRDRLYNEALKKISHGQSPEYSAISRLKTSLSSTPNIF